MTRRLIDSGFAALAMSAAIASLPTAASAQARPTLDGLQSQLTALAALVVSLQGQLAAVQSNSVLALNGKLAYDSASATARFTGVDVQVVNGEGPLSINGRGNLIVGYNTPRGEGMPICGGEQVAPDVCSASMGMNFKIGSHYLVVGEGHSYTSVGGVVFGYRNAATAFGAGVLGGEGNVSAGMTSTAHGGYGNLVTG